VAAAFQAPELFVIAEDLSKMELLVNVAEADIGRLEAKQAASFTVDAWPDRTYNASVTKVSFGSTVTDNVVTYETELDVPNDDLTLRPGMTATSEITVVEEKDVLVVPNAALRFTPPSPDQADGAEKKESGSFMSSLTSSSRGKGGGGGSRVAKTGSKDGAAPKGTNTPQHIWILKNGEPVQLRVKVGITDGRYTQISGRDVTEGLKVITSALIPKS
jgi:HlyD family secretion protein